MRVSCIPPRSRRISITSMHTVSCMITTIHTRAVRSKCILLYCSILTACWHDWFPFQAGFCIVTLGLLLDPLSLSDPHMLIGCNVRTRYLVSGVEPTLPLEQFKLLTTRLHLHPLSHRTDHRRQRIRCTVQSEVWKQPGIRIRKS